MSVLASTSGQFFLKSGAVKLGKVNLSNALNQILSIIATPELLIGLACYAMGAVTYILLLTRVNLSIAAPSSSLVYIFSVLLGYFFFRESITLVRLLGLSFIVSGIILVIWRK
ncbi:EamA family transporter [Aetokthonos hydrillicola CCALA 1050]|jgi:drug/metabolite transporter (DMT)-like permease|nr:EamA family transporter [Aetokthonos hydrillicola CCALA 1050]